MKKCIQLLVLLCGLQAGSEVRAQDDKPWFLYFDTQSTSACDVVNADNAKLVVLQTGQMVIVSGSDVTLEDVIVDSEGFVTFEGEAAGLIDFALDGDGLRSLWWMSLVGEVARINGRTGAPSFTDNFPEEYSDAGCDACEYWDDVTLCPEEPPVPSICGAGLPSVATLTFASLLGTRFRRRSARS